MKHKNIKSVVLLEDHHLAYKQWVKRKFHNKIIVHIDAHLDYQPADKNNMNLGNFLYFAAKDKIFKKMYWVVPGTVKELKNDVFEIVKILKNIQRYNIYKNQKHKKITFYKGIISTNIDDIRIHICTIDTLPDIKNPVLLDIDIDYFIVDRLKNSSPFNNIGERKQWLTLNEFMHNVKKLQKIKYTTIVYSVNGGYTPQVYKTIADKLVYYFDQSYKKSSKIIAAGENFKKFRQYFDKRDVTEAKKYYQMALYLNKKYSNPYNNYGMLFLKKKDIGNAEKEFGLMLKINPSDLNSITGLAVVKLYQKNYLEARKLFNRIITLDPHNKTGYLYLSYMEYKFKNYNKARNYLSKYAKHKKYQLYAHFLYAKLSDLGKYNNQTEKLYTKVLNYKKDISIPVGLELLI